MVRDPAATSAERPASSEQAADPLDDLPPSAKFVRYVLRRVGPMTTGEIAEETALSEYTVYEALDRLQEDTDGVGSDAGSDGWPAGIVVFLTFINLNQRVGYRGPGCWLRFCINSFTRRLCL